MSLFFKIVAAIAGLLILIIGGVAIYLTTLFDANDYKSEIQALVKQQTQLTLSIDGELKLSVFPWLGVSVEDTSIDTPDGHLASAGHVQIFARFLPLLKGEIEVDGIALRNLKLQLVKNAEGRGNWEIISEKSKKQQPPTTSQASEISPPAFSLGYLEIENAHVSYKDLSNGAFHQFQNMNLRVGSISANSDFPVTADFAYASNTSSTPIEGRLTSQISLNLDQQTLTLANTVLDIGATRINTDLEIVQLLKAPFIDGRFAITDFKVAEWSSILQQPALADSSLKLGLKADFQFDTAKGQAAMQNLSASGPGLTLQGAMTASGLNDTPSFIGNLAINELNPRSLLNSMGIEAPDTASSSVLKSLTGKLDFKGSASEVQLNNIKLKLDNSNLQGSAGIDSFKNMASRFALNIDQLNLDDYLPATATTESAPEQKPNPSQSGDDAALLPLDTLRELTTRGRLRIDKLIASGLQIDNFDANLRAANGFINLTSLTANLYEGGLNSSASIDARSKTPQFNFNNRISGVQAAPLLTALTETDYLAGKMDLQLKGTAFGNNLSAIKRTISGEADFNISDGLLKNTNIEQLVCKSVARIRNRDYSVDSQQPNTRFKQLNGHANIVKGVVQTDRLTIALNNIQVTGNGQINLPEENLDFGIRANIRGDLENQACEVHERYRDVAWPIRCQGNFSDEPSKLCRLDQRELQSIAAQLAKKEVQNKISDKLDDKLGDKLKDKLGDDAADKLKGLLGF